MTKLPQPPSTSQPASFDGRADALFADRAAGVAEWVNYTMQRLQAAEKDGDPESAHGEADAALCDLISALGHPEIVEAWDKVGKWYS